MLTKGTSEPAEQRQFIEIRAGGRVLDVVRARAWCDEFKDPGLVITRPEYETSDHRVPR